MHHNKTKMETTHILRLRRLAEHLLSGALSRRYDDMSLLRFGKDSQLIFHDDKYYQILPWSEEELDFIFPSHFTRNHKGIVVNIKKPNVAVIYTLPEFFHLDTDQFAHCFLIGKQTRDWGRLKMKTDSSPKHCGKIILHFLKKMEHKKKIESNVEVRRVLFEKINKNAPESILRKLLERGQE